MAPSVTELWELLESSNSRERQEGIVTFRSIYGAQRNVDQIARHSRTGKQDYLFRTVTALIACVSADRQAVLRKNNNWQAAAPQTLSRLRDSANALRWLIELVNKHLTQPSMHALLTHIISAINDRGKLFEPIALDYTKALNALLSRPAHVQHMSIDLWTQTVALCFNAVLGDKLNSSLRTDITDEDWDQAASQTASSAVPRKEIGPEVLSLVAAIRALCTSKSAPLLTDKRGVGVLFKLAQWFGRFPKPTSAHTDAMRSVNSLLLELHLNDRRTTTRFVQRMWPTILAYIPTRFKTLKEQVFAFATISLPIMANPFQPGPDGDEAADQPAAIQQLHQLLLAESQIRGGVEELSFQDVELVIKTGTEHEANSNGAFAALHLKTLRPRNGTAQHTLSWATLRLLADCTALLMRWASPSIRSEDGTVNRDSTTAAGALSGELGKRARHDQAEVADPDDGTGSRKRRRTLVDPPAANIMTSTAAGTGHTSTDYDALGAVIHDIDARRDDVYGHQENRRVWAVQSVLFLVEGHWSTLNERARRDILVALLGQLGAEATHRVQASIFIALAACAIAEAALPESSRTQVFDDYWSQIWFEACRKIFDVATSRVAAHAACALLHHQGPLIPKAKLLASLKSMLQSLDIEGPAAFSDSTCAFMREALRHVNGDVLLAQANLEVRVLDWVNRSWSSLSGAARRVRAPAMPELDAVDLILLLMRIARLQVQGALCRPDPMIEHSELLECVVAMHELRAARKYLFEAALTTSEDQGSPSTETVEESPSKAPLAQHSLSPVQRRCCDVLQALCNSIIEQLETRMAEDGVANAPDERYGALTSIEESIRILRSSVTALVFASGLRVSGIQVPEALTVGAERLFVQAVSFVTEPRWSLPHRLLLLQALRPLLPPISTSLSQQGAHWISQALVDVGEHSGISRELLRRTQPQRLSAPARFIPSLWSSSTLDAGSVLKVFQSALSELMSPSTQKVHSDEGEKLSGFDNDDEATATDSPMFEDTTQIPAEMQSAFRNGVSLCVEAIALIPFLGRLQESSADSWLLDLLLNVPDVHFTTLASCIFDAMASGRLTLSVTDQNHILNRLGESHLTLYEYGRVPEVQVVGASLIQATMNDWIQPAETVEGEEFASTMLEFFTFFTGQSSRIRSSQVRLHLVVLFDKFLEADPAQESWASASQTSTLPLSALVGLAEDPNFTVRLAAAKAQAKALEKLQDSGANVQAVYVSIRDLMPTAFDEYERTATLLVYAANVVIASSPSRGPAMNHLLEPAWDSSRHRPLIRTLLSNAAAKLGFRSSTEFYKIFSSNLTFEFMKADVDPVNMDVQTLGYDSRDEYSLDLLTEIGSTMLLSDLPTGHTYLASHALRAKLSEEQVLLACFPSVAAHRLVWAAQQVQGKDAGPQAFKKAWKQARDTLAVDMRVRPSEIDTLIERRFHDILAALLKLMFDPDSLAPNGHFVQDLNGSNKDCAKVLIALEGNFQTPMHWDLHEPYNAHETGSAVYGGLVTLMMATGDNLASACFNEDEVYNAAHMLFETIGQARFVNDQLRHLDALKLWIAVNSSTIVASPSLHRSIMHGVAVAMQRQELAASAAGVLGWCIDLVLQRGIAPTTHFKDDFLLAAQAAIRFVERVEDDPSRQLGAGLLRWLENLMLALLDVDEVKNNVVMAVLAWPRQLSNSFLAIRDHLPFDEMRAALKQMSGRSIKAHHLEGLVTAMRTPGQSSSAEHESFAGTDFWQLLVKVGEAHADRDDASDPRSTAALGDRLAEIIHAMNGRVRAPSLAALNAMSDIRSIGGQGSSKSMSDTSKAEHGLAALKGKVLSRLLKDLHSSDGATMASAYHRLRRLKTVDSHPERFLPHADDANAAEVQFIAPAAEFQLARSGMTPPSSYPQVDLAAQTHVWAPAFVQALLNDLATSGQDAFFKECCEIVTRDQKLAIDLIPMATVVLLQLFKEGHAPKESKSKLTKHFSALLRRDTVSHSVWTTIIQSVLAIKANSYHAHDIGLDVDLLSIARRAMDCKLYSTALMFIELSLDPNRQRGSSAATEAARAGDFGQHRASAITPDVARMLHEIYNTIDDPDGFYGIPFSDVQENYARQMEHEGEWRKALDLHATQLEARMQSGQGAVTLPPLGRLTNAMHQLSYNFSASLLVQSKLTNAQLDHGSSGLPTSIFDIAWRLGEWDLPVDGVDDELYPGHGLWTALRALARESDQSSADHIIASMISNEVHQLGGLNLESFAKGQLLCRNLLSLREIRDVRQLTKGTSMLQSAAQLQDRWARLASADFEYNDFERICAVRHCLVKLERHRIEATRTAATMNGALQSLPDLEATVLLQSSEASRLNNHLQKAMTAVTTASLVRLALTPDLIHFKIGEEQASVLWEQNSHNTAIKALTECLARQPSTNGVDLQKLHRRRASALAKLGTWTATARAESSETIEQKYFAKAIEAIRETGKDTSEHGTIAYKYAVFADAQYRHISTSSELQRVRRFVERRTAELELNEQENQRVKNVEHQKALSIHKRKTMRQLRADQAQLSTLENICTLFLEKALTMYATSLRYTEEHDEVIFPFSSLWFENSANVKANVDLATWLNQVPSHKFIPLTHQLSARLSPGTTTLQAQAFTSNLTTLLTRMCAEHPFHTMYAIYALKKAGVDYELSQSSRGSPSPSLSTQSTRAKAADAIWLTVKSNSALRARIQALETVCACYVHWAELNLRDYPALWSGHSFKKGSHQVPQGVKLRQLRDVDVPVATRPLPIDITGKYQDFVRIRRYSDLFSTAGGLHLPKIIDCLGSDGKRYKQLFKSEDDLRQDAVIQQVFKLVNGMLAKDRRSRARRLTVRGYIVLPLGPQCGLLEFVSNTKPLGEVLTGLHDKYRRQDDLSANDAKQMLVRMRGHQKPEPRIDAYKQVCARFPPAMRYHFLEAQHLPAAWQVMRLSYIRSVATTSIVGHILGLGDRHVSNILMDEASGEIVHIDFGYVFEQGKLLPVPELVPFRLTRDLVDGMGILGVEGSFRRCCQETLRVMRDGADTIKTVLEVFKYDPLFEWMTNPIKLLKAQANQDDETTTANVDAIRGGGLPVGAASTVQTSAGGGQGSGGHQDTAELSADYAVSTVMSKLSTTLSVEHTVNDLIQQARNVDSLGAIYFGWSAHL